MIRTGIDAVEIERFSKMENLQRFVKRVFTEKEQLYFASKKNPAESIAGHYAAKEAFSKYMGTGVRSMSFRDIEILYDELGKPYIMFKNQRVTADLSITHSRIIAAAVVCGEEAYTLSADTLMTYSALLPKRRDDMHKGDCGRLFILAGSRGMTGAAELCAKAALRCGSGLVTVGTPLGQQPVLAVKLTEAMTLALPEEDGFLSERACGIIREKTLLNDVCVLGPGLGRTDGVRKCIYDTLSEGKPILADADGLNAISAHIDILEQRHTDTVLTPHSGEMSALCGLPVAEVNSQREKIAAEFAVRYKVTLVLKGKNTVVASPNGEVTINPTGNSGMASGGMGDVLSGVIGSFMGQGLGGYDAAVLGVFIHGLAGDLAASELGEFGMIAGDVVKYLPYAIKMLQ